MMARTRTQRRRSGCLHADCGNCHDNPGTAWPDTQMLPRLDADANGVKTAAVLGSVVGQRLQYFRDQASDITLRVVAGHPRVERHHRAHGRARSEGADAAARDRTVDEAGVALVSRWIAALPE